MVCICLTPSSSPSESIARVPRSPPRAPRASHRTAPHRTAVLGQQNANTNTMTGFARHGTAPLQVHRVDNDGDCFFSSIKAALPDGAAAGTEAAGTGRALTVAEMREWVAEETGEEQLEFYILQAGAHPEDRWWVERFRFFIFGFARFSFRVCSGVVFGVLMHCEYVLPHVRKVSERRGMFVRFVVSTHVVLPPILSLWKVKFYVSVCVCVYQASHYLGL